MIKIIVFVLGIFIFYKIFINKGNYKSLLWIIISLFLINGRITIINFPINIPILRWLILSLLITYIFYYNTLIRNFKSFPLKNITIFLIICSFTIGLTDNRLSIFNKLFLPFREIIETYLILFLGYCTIRKTSDTRKLIQPIFIALIIITVYGLFNYMFQINPYYEWVIDNFFVGGETDLRSAMRALDVTQERYRVVSTFREPFIYGYTSSLLLLFYIYTLSKYNNLKIYWIAIFSGLIGVFLSASRTVLFSAFISLIIYFLIGNKISGSIKYMVMFLIIISIGYSTSTTIRNSIDMTMDVFETGGEKTSGSSIDMRNVQLIASTKYFLQSPILGNGYGYINNELGWGDRDNSQLDSDLYGFESIIYQLMIEQGLLGLFSKFLFFISLISYFAKNIKNNKKLSALGISIVFLFLSFSIGTGPLSTWPITMFFLGVIIKEIEIDRLNKKYYIYTINKDKNAEK